MVITGWGNQNNIDQWFSWTAVDRQLLAEIETSQTDRKLANTAFEKVNIDKINITFYDEQ